MLLFMNGCNYTAFIVSTLDVCLILLEDYIFPIDPVNMQQISETLHKSV